MIWFFLMGMIAGAVGMVMYANYWMRKHTVVVRKEDMNETGHPGTNRDRDPEGREVPEPERDADGQDRMGSAPGQCMEDTEQGKGNEGC